jgi:Fe-S-cluster containining protein
MNPIERYLDLVRRIDEDTQRLTALHGGDITCSPGCTDCCVDITVFPVEFYAIRLAMTRAGVQLGTDAFDPAAACGFLQDGLCRIYPFRPIICRTHGLPILYLDDVSGKPVWEVSFCELNFTGHNAVEFTAETLLNIEDINTELSIINRDFIVLEGIMDEARPARVALKKLCV